MKKVKASSGAFAAFGEVYLTRTFSYVFAAPVPEKTAFFFFHFPLASCGKIYYNNYVCKFIRSLYGGMGI